ncbi:hypothetical protein BGZ83_007260 [Gryganskiella cystojenkinii]|nr:hypothetical protein BGZ83_007260 [Gryganskiella cystojenkinii]
MPVDFDKQEYWTERFSHEQTFEWLMPWSILEPRMHELNLLPTPCNHNSNNSKKTIATLTTSTTSTTTAATSLEPASPSSDSFPFYILNLGCGNSDLPLDLYQAGYPHVLSVDFVGSVVERLKGRCEQAIGWTEKKDYEQQQEINDDIAKEDNDTTANETGPRSPSSTCPLQFQEMDCLDMSSLPPNHFHLCIDKSTSDAISCGDDDNYKKLRTLCDQVARVTRPGGFWIVVSYSRFRQYEWTEGLGQGLWKTEGIHEIKVEAPCAPPLASSTDKPSPPSSPESATSTITKTSSSTKQSKKAKQESARSHQVHVADLAANAARLRLPLPLRRLPLPAIASREASVPVQNPATVALPLPRRAIVSLEVHAPVRNPATVAPPLLRPVIANLEVHAPVLNPAIVAPPLPRPVNANLEEPAPVRNLAPVARRRVDVAVRRGLVPAKASPEQNASAILIASAPRSTGMVVVAPKALAPARASLEEIASAILIASAPRSMGMVVAALKAPAPARVRPVETASVPPTASALKRAPAVAPKAPARARANLDMTASAVAIANAPSKSVHDLATVEASGYDNQNQDHERATPPRLPTINRTDPEEIEILPGSKSDLKQNTGMTQEDERTAATAASRGAHASTSSTQEMEISSGNSAQQESSHDRHSRAGHIGASAKVGFQDSDTAMTKAKYKVESTSGDGTGASGDQRHHKHEDHHHHHTRSVSFFEGDGPAPPAVPEIILTPHHLARTKSGVKYELGTILWCKVMDCLYPSQLSKLANVNKFWRAQIYHLPIWKGICETSGLTLTVRELDEFGYDGRPNYFRIAHENAEMICEGCYRSTRTSGAFRALPVHLKGALIPTEVLLCRDCRVELYMEHPEPIPDNIAPYECGEFKITPRMTKGEAMKTYLLTDSDIMSLPYEMGRNPYFSGRSPMYLFEEQNVLRLARQVHGGDAGLAAVRADSKAAGRKVPEPSSDVFKHRRNLLRSLLHDKGLHLPEHAAICQIYIEYGRGDPVAIVAELEAVDWFHRCTSYDPSLDKAHLKQVKRRERITRTRDTSETSSAKKRGTEEVEDEEKGAKEIQDEIMTKEEEEIEDQHKLHALDDWLQHRIHEGLFHSYKQDPEGPDKPPKTVWPLLDQIDICHKLVQYAAERVFRSMERQKHMVVGAGLDKFKMSKSEVRIVIDAPDLYFEALSDLTKRKRRKISEDEDKDSSLVKDDRFPRHQPVPKLSALLEHDVGARWQHQVLEQAKELARARF